MDWAREDFGVQISLEEEEREKEEEVDALTRAKRDWILLPGTEHRWQPPSGYSLVALYFLFQHVDCGRNAELVSCMDDELIFLHGKGNKKKIRVLDTLQQQQLYW